MMNCTLHCLKIHNNQTVELIDGDYIDETESFSFYIECDYDLGDVRIDITDIPIKLDKLLVSTNKFEYIFNYDSIKDYFTSQKFRIDNYSKEFFVSQLNQKILFFKLFVNYPIGLCDILLIDNSTEKVIKSFNLNVTSSKINDSEFNSLVKYVEAKSTSIWTKHSLLKHTATSLNSDDKLEWLMIFCENFVNELNKNHLHFFSFDKIKVIKQKNEVINFSTDVCTTDDSLFWLINNLDTLYPTTSYDENKIIISNRLFAPLEIQSSSLEESTDTNENQIIHGFITELRLFLSQIIDTFNENINKCSKITFEGNLIFYSYKRSLNRLNEIKKGLNEVKYNLEKYIPVTIETLDHLNTNKIEFKEHYSFVYNSLLEWLLYKNATYTKDKRLFKGINRMDQLFEKACFYKLIDAFKKLEFEVEEINNYKVKLIKKGVIHHLYSQTLPEKLISVRAKNEHGNSSGNLKPDFTIEFENGKFIIIDAKYKKSETIKKYDYPDLTLKYLHGIGLYEGGFFNPLALFILFPEVEGEFEFYQKNKYDLFSNSPAYPSIGSIGVNFETESRILNGSIEILLNT
jgi:predicted component of viral defense system (DUF524 family)